MMAISCQRPVTVKARCFSESFVRLRSLRKKLSSCCMAPHCCLWWRVIRIPALSISTTVLRISPMSVSDTGAKEYHDTCATWVSDDNTFCCSSCDQQEILLLMRLPTLWCIHHSVRPPCSLESGLPLHDCKWHWTGSHHPSKLQPDGGRRSWWVQRNSFWLAIRNRSFWMWPGFLCCNPNWYILIRFT